MPLHRPALTETILSRWEEAGTDRSVATLQMATEAVDAVLGYLAAEVDLPRTAYGPDPMSREAALLRVPVEGETHWAILKAHADAGGLQAPEMLAASDGQEGGLTDDQLDEVLGTVATRSSRPGRSVMTTRPPYFIQASGWKRLTPNGRRRANVYMLTLAGAVALEGKMLRRISPAALARCAPPRTLAADPSGHAVLSVLGSGTAQGVRGLDEQPAPQVLGVEPCALQDL